MSTNPLLQQTPAPSTDALVRLAAELLDEIAAREAIAALPPTDEQVDKETIRGHEARRRAKRTAVLELAVIAVVVLALAFLLPHAV